MGISLEKEKLLSRSIRWAVGEGRSGEGSLSSRPAGAVAKNRKIGSLTQLQSRKEGEGNFLTWIWNTGRAIVGFLWKALASTVTISVSAIFGWLVQAAYKVVNFNWQASDEDLRKQQHGRNTALAGVWGGVVGQGLGWMTAIGVGYGVSLVVPVIGGAALARTIATRGTLEGLEEVLPTLRNAMLQTVQTQIGNLLTSGYINVRRLIKNLPKDSRAGFLGPALGGLNSAIETWGNKGNKPWSMAQSWEESLEKIPHEALRNFLENAAEEFWESFIEGGFVIASELDAAYAQSRLQRQQQQGPPRSIKIQPNTAVSGEALIFRNVPQRALIPAVQQTLALNALIHNRDVGTLVGMPVEEFVKARPQSLRIVITMMSRPSPPFVSSQGAVKQVRITIPDVSRARLDWAYIKACCGGANGYMWGRFRATANLDNGRQLAVYAATEAEAEERLLVLSTLTTAEILTFSVTEEKRRGVRATNPKLQKEATRVYPAHFSIINREEILNPTRGSGSQRQPHYVDKRNKIPLWPDSKPEGTEQIISELLRTGFS